MAPGAEAGAIIKIACAVMPMFQTPMTPGASPALRAEQQLQSHAHLDADDYARVDEGIDAVGPPPYAAMQRLTHQDRQLLELVAVNGLSAVETARALSISPVAARVRLTPREDGSGLRCRLTADRVPASGARSRSQD
jgi:hypothetical protein